MTDAHDDLDLQGAFWRGMGKEYLDDPSCGRPYVMSNIVYSMELVKTLNAQITAPCHFVAPTGATVDVDIEMAETLIAGDDYCCLVEMLPERIAITYEGNHGGEGVVALYLLDWLHECGELPTRQRHLSGAELVNLSELRQALDAEQRED